MVALIGIWVATLMNWMWIWAIVFLTWAINDIIIGSTNFIEYVDKKENPVLFWIIITSWILLSVLMVFPSLLGNPNAIY